jgi:hypothetical protein
VRFLRLFVIGTVVQAAGLVGFILVSRTAFAPFLEAVGDWGHGCVLERHYTAFDRARQDLSLVAHGRRVVD